MVVCVATHVAAHSTRAVTANVAAAAAACAAAVEIQLVLLLLLPPSFLLLAVFLFGLVECLNAVLRRVVDPESAFAEVFHSVNVFTPANLQATFDHLFEAGKALHEGASELAAVHDSVPETVFVFICPTRYECEVLVASVL